MKQLIRTAVLATAAAGLLAAPVTAGQATAAPEVPHEGGYVGRVDNPGPIRAVKQEAVEFFWYDCYHSRQLELPLERWSAKHASDVTLRRVPAVWAGAPEERVQKGHARLYYTLEKLGKVDEFQVAAFKAVNVDEQDVITEDTATAWAGTVGLDAEKFRAAYRSAEVRDLTEAASGLMAKYKVDELPTVFVNGDRAKPSKNGGVEGMPAALDALVD
ncbi:thiol:disulfide interchange protein DsbA [Kitasatospora albolonga]|uniref:thiol:disulfide interchange protein DsbA/DsbL n=1 Tax=Kitasatospora albolonga TaxID=68173 RepID=UPI0031EB587C